MGQRTIAYTYLMMPHSVIGATGIMSVQNKCVPAALSCVATTPSRNVRVCSQRKLWQPAKKPGRRRLVTRHHVAKFEVSGLYSAADT